MSFVWGIYTDSMRPGAIGEGASVPDPSSGGLVSIAHLWRPLDYDTRPSHIDMAHHSPQQIEEKGVHAMSQRAT
eukprot:1820710-Pyramimonas_sp.AAC.1